ncbi:MAG: right-handed parallel beta-helix repeat-containing protein, partial [Deltaproteobacteria bacterium]|nr:right-handed parallel beta-helix repeat-containing protein [Deltaproteobacteria bacterium]
MRAAPCLVAASVVIALVSIASEAWARDVPVSDSAGLRAAIEGAVAGDVILLADGTYSSGDVRCNAMGRADAPIVVRAMRRLGARIELSGLEGFVVTGDHWHFEDLDVQGVCPPGDGNCEHAFHVSGAQGFVLRRARVRDFHAQLKVNAASDGAGGWREPHGGLVEHCEIADTAPRQTDAPVTKLNIDSGDDWIVRGNFIHDFHKNGGNEISYAAFMKSGGRRGLFERNLVVCTLDVDTGGTRLGLSFGGGGTAPQFCAPAFDASVPCDVEHADGVMRNNVVANCNDVGIYLNRAANTRLLHNTLVATAGIDFRFATSSGEAHGNVLAGRIRSRDGASFTAGTNLEELGDAFFTALYRAPSRGDLSLAGDAAMLVGRASARPDVLDDYCGR